jgi:hypothetical protein
MTFARIARISTSMAVAWCMLIAGCSAPTGATQESLTPPARASSSTESTHGVGAPKAPLRSAGSLYFVGNSYMGNCGGINNYFRKALASAEPPLTCRAIAKIYYGQPLRAMFTPQVQRKIASGNYDTIVITSGDLETMKKFDTLIRQSGAKTVVYMTWAGRHPGNGVDAEAYRDATARSVRAMRQMEKDTGATIFPLAVIYHDLTTRPAREGLRVDYLWEPGNIHQNELGMVVNSWAIYSVLTGKPPRGLDYDMGTWVVGDKLRNNPDTALDADLRRRLQDRVWEVVRQWRAGETEFDGPGARLQR